jgi:indolepyruvate ferredoxin oxidoreductase alpha subunit
VDGGRRSADFDWKGFSYRVVGFDKLFRRHGERHEKLDLVQEEFEQLDFNELKMNGDEKLGIISVGFSFSYIIDALRRLGVEDETAYLKLATPYPLPEELRGKFLKSVDRSLVAEEVDPFVELHVKALAKDVNQDLEILGRLSGHLPREGEFTPTIITEAVADILDVEASCTPRVELEAEVRDILFDRMLTLCAGCPHRATVYALKRTVKEMKGDHKGVVVNGDIGCYGLAHTPPLSFEDTYFCMGASIGVSQGMAQVGVDAVALIGDGTFFHAGIPALINAVYNGADIKVVVADNQTIAMTGFQPHPESGRTATGKPAKRIMIEDIASACGVKHIEVVDPYDLEATEDAFKRMLEAEGVAMTIARRVCAIEAVRNMRPSRPIPYAIDPDSCIGCRICLSEFGCPALIWIGDVGRAYIEPALCMGCSVCSVVCPQEAINRIEES